MSMLLICSLICVCVCIHMQLFNSKLCIFIVWLLLHLKIVWFYFYLFIQITYKINVTSTYFCMLFKFLQHVFYKDGNSCRSWNSPSLFVQCLFLVAPYVTIMVDVAEFDNANPINTYMITSDPSKCSPF